MLYQRVRRPFWRRHPWVVGAALLLVFWQLHNGSYVLLAVMTIAGLVIAVKRRRRAIALRDAGLRARADYEHQLSLAGDPRGTFGRYPPVQAGWFPDPQNRSRVRYFDGAMWTPYAVPR
jgi:Protein of unknown function (DUF2510)